MIEKKMQVFVSSTYHDLKAERQAAVEAILTAGHIPAGMELFAAGDASQWETIKRWIESSDVYMLILGGRYGSIEPTSGKSYIELEYDYAVSLNKPLFAVVIDDDHLDEKVKSDGRKVVETDHGAELKAFRARVMGKMVRTFSRVEDIKLAVHESMPQLIRDRELEGWVRGGAVKTVEDVEDRRRLENRVRDLEAEIAARDAKGMEDYSEFADGTDRVRVRIRSRSKDAEPASADLTWEDLFKVVGKAVMTSPGIRSVDRAILRCVAAAAGADIHRGEWHVHGDDFGVIEAQFVALNYIAVTHAYEQPTAASNSGMGYRPGSSGGWVTAWSLTQRGQRHLANLIAIKKATHATSIQMAEPKDVVQAGEESIA